MKGKKRLWSMLMCLDKRCSLNVSFVPIRDDESLKFRAHKVSLVNCYYLHLNSEHKDVYKAAYVWVKRANIP